MSKKIIRKIRKFNRIYMPKMNLLGNSYLGSEYSVTEARIFFEIYDHPGCSASHIAKIMNIDKSYLSRILKSHKKNGYIEEKVSDDDMRVHCLYLTESGKERAEDFIKKSDAEIEKIIAPLNEDEKNLLFEYLDGVENLLMKI